MKKSYSAAYIHDDPKMHNIALVYQMWHTQKYTLHKFHQFLNNMISMGDRV